MRLEDYVMENAIEYACLGPKTSKNRIEINENKNNDG